jgi:hypothetical protein
VGEIGVTWLHEKPGKWDQLFRDRRFPETFRIYFSGISSAVSLSFGKGSLVFFSVSFYDFAISVSFPPNVASFFVFGSPFFCSKTDGKFPFRFQPLKVKTR